MTPGVLSDEQQDETFEILVRQPGNWQTDVSWPRSWRIPAIGECITVRGQEWQIRDVGFDPAAKTVEIWVNGQ